MKWWEQLILDVYNTGSFVARSVMFCIMFLVCIAVGFAILIVTAFVVYVGLMTLVEAIRPDLLPYP